MPCLGRNGGSAASGSLPGSTFGSLPGSIGQPATTMLSAPGGPNVRIYLPPAASQSLARLYLHESGTPGLPVASPHPPAGPCRADCLRSTRRDDEVAAWCRARGGTAGSPSSMADITLPRSADFAPCRHHRQGTCFQSGRRCRFRHRNFYPPAQGGVARRNEDRRHRAQPLNARTGGHRNR